MKTVTIINYEVGNLFSICSALDFLGYKYNVSDQEKVINSSDAIILPGVGAFNLGMQKLKEKNLDQIIQNFAFVKERPILGICLGMQLLATTSQENGEHNGLNLIPGKVLRLRPNQRNYTTHVGWSSLTQVKENSFLAPSLNKNFYFDHSYHFVPDSREHILSTSEYGLKIVSALQRDNIYGLQFHPEKSQKAGLRALRHFFTGCQFS